MIIQRRALLTGCAASLLAAPAIVRAASLMPVKALPATTVLRWLVNNCGVFDCSLHEPVIDRNGDRLVHIAYANENPPPTGTAAPIEISVSRRANGSLLLSSTLEGEFIRPNGEVYFRRGARASARWGCQGDGNDGESP